MAYRDGRFHTLVGNPFHGRSEAVSVRPNSLAEGNIPCHFHLPCRDGAIVKLTRRASVALLVAAPMVLATGAGFTASAQTNPNTTQLANSAAPGLEFATR